MNKQEYLEGLKAVGELFGEAAPEAEKQEKPEEAEKPEATPAAEPVAEAPAPVETPKETEPFEGFNLLPEATRKTLQERIEAAAKLDEQLKQREHELKQAQSRLAPIQQQLSREQIEKTRMQQQLNDYESRFRETLTTEQKKKLDEYRAQFPTELEAMETIVAPALREVTGLKRELEELRNQSKTLAAQAAIQEQLSILSRAHPDWAQQRNSPEFAEWLDRIDPYVRETIIVPRLKSKRAEDSIFVLNQFKHDEASRRNSAPQAQQATPTAPAVLAPVVDPDPSRRQTSPSSTAGQPMSEKKRAYLEASQYFEREVLGKPRRQRA